MLRLSANLSFLFTEVPFLERFGAAARAGFTGGEFAFAYDVPVTEIAARLSEHALACVLLNAPPGDLSRGERGLASLPGRHEPDIGEINYAWLLRRVDELGYDGWVRCEYRPLRDTLSGLAWRERLLVRMS